MPLLLRFGSLARSLDWTGSCEQARWRFFLARNANAPSLALVGWLVLALIGSHCSRSWTEMTCSWGKTRELFWYLTGRASCSLLTRDSPPISLTWKTGGADPTSTSWQSEIGGKTVGKSPIRESCVQLTAFPKCDSRNRRCSCQPCFPGSIISSRDGDMGSDTNGMGYAGCTVYRGSDIRADLSSPVASTEAHALGGAVKAVSAVS